MKISTQLNQIFDLGNEGKANVNAELVQAAEVPKELNDSALINLHAILSVELAGRSPTTFIDNSYPVPAAKEIFAAAQDSDRSIIANWVNNLSSSVALQVLNIYNLAINSNNLAASQSTCAWPGGCDLSRNNLVIYRDLSAKAALKFDDFGFIGIFVKISVHAGVIHR